MTVDEALSEPDYIEDTVDAYRTLAAEVRRYRAAVEAIRSMSAMTELCRGRILAILEGKK